MTLTEARENVGAAVVYKCHPDADPEEGTIVRVGEEYVFVLYRGDYTPKATPAKSLDFATKEIFAGGHR